jgi:ribosomal protein L37AE/L43A
MTSVAADDANPIHPDCGRPMTRIRNQQLWLCEHCTTGVNVRTIERKSVEREYGRGISNAV